MAINNAGLEFDELDIHIVVDTCREAVVVRTGALKSPFLAEIVKSYVVSVVLSSTRHVDIMVLAYSGLEHCIKPVGINLCRIQIERTVLIVPCRNIHSVVGKGNIHIITVLACIHHIIYTFTDLIHAKVTGIINLHGLVFLTAFGCDYDHTVCGTRAVDSRCRCILEDLNGLYVIR